MGIQRKNNLTRFIDKVVSRNNSYMVQAGVTGSDRGLRRNKKLQEQLKMIEENMKIKSLKEIFKNVDKAYLVFSLLSISTLIFMLIISYNYYN